MRPLLRRFIVLSMSLIVLGSFKPVKHHPVQTDYYWYWTDTDMYLFYESTAQAITDLQNSLGQAVNTSPFGGTLVAKGYSNNVYPHNSSAWVLLYSH